MKRELGERTTGRPASQGPGLPGVPLGADSAAFAPGYEGLRPPRSPAPAAASGAAPDSGHVPRRVARDMTTSATVARST
jgi:hypothetical protein